MPRILIYTDVHWSSYSSIVRRRGEKYSIRLEKLIDSVNFAEREAERLECQYVVCLGDFFESSTLNSEEITALSEIKWSSSKHFFIVGNHEASNQDLSYNSLNALEKVGKIIREPYVETTSNNQRLVFLPYMVNTPNPIKDLLPPLEIRDNNSIIFSHNDISGIQYGSSLSTKGFDIKDVEDNCKLFFNGHIHNCGIINSKIINVGNLCGQNFKEDSFTYKHFISVLDTDTCQYEFFENPYALNFYKIHIANEQDLIQLRECKDTNAVISIHCNDIMAEDIKKELININPIEYRLNINYNTKILEDNILQQHLSLDYLEMFSDFVLKNLGEDDIIKEELEEIMK